MQKKTVWIIAVTVLCAVVLGVTVWCVWRGVQSVLPEPPETQEDAPLQEPEVQEELTPPVDEYGNPLDSDGNPIANDNTVINPWLDAPAEEQENGETPSDSESISNDPDLAVSDEGWTGIY